MNSLTQAAARTAQAAPRLARSIATKNKNPLAAELVSFNNPTSPSFGLARFVQANFFRSNAVYVATIIGAAVIGGGIYDATFEFLWKQNNKGKLYEDMIGRYPGLPPNTEPEEGAEEQEE